MKLDPNDFSKRLKSRKLLTGRLYAIKKPINTRTCIDYPARNIRAFDNCISFAINGLPSHSFTVFTRQKFVTPHSIEQKGLASKGSPHAEGAMHRPATFRIAAVCRSSDRLDRLLQPPAFTQNTENQNTL